MISQYGRGSTISSISRHTGKLVSGGIADTVARRFESHAFVPMPVLPKYRALLLIFGQTAYWYGWWYDHSHGRIFRWCRQVYAVDTSQADHKESPREASAHDAEYIDRSSGVMAIRFFTELASQKRRVWSRTCSTRSSTNCWSIALYLYMQFHVTITNSNYKLNLKLFSFCSHFQLGEILTCLS